MAEALGFRDVTIAAVGMESVVVDCFIHVDCCMLK
jgi:hypothetical protein